MRHLVMGLLGHKRWKPPVATIAAIGLFCTVGRCEAAEPPKPKKPSVVQRVIPSRYIVDYPATERFHPPVLSAFQDAVNTDYVHNGKRVKTLANGGFGVATSRRNGVPYFHTGADLGWFRTGDPVFAVADGIVRRSDPGLRRLNFELKLNLKLPSGAIDYGNLIIIEHRTPDGDEFLTLYAHLGDDRLVRPGDVVTAGQLIGTIGREDGKVNGGYRPHCHFAVHDGQWLQPGHQLMTVKIEGVDSTIRLAEAGEKVTRVTVTPPIPNSRLNFGDGNSIRLRREGDLYVMPSFPLWQLASGNAARLAGYLPTVEGFRDPIAFLKQAGADSRPAPVLKSSIIHPRDQPAVVDQPAPELSVTEWLQPESDPPKISELEGKVVCLVFFQTGCEGSLSHGLPALKELADQYEHSSQVRVIGVHLAMRDFRRNSPLNMRKQIGSTGLRCPVAQLGDAETPPEIESFGVRATPWVVLVDTQGTIDFSNWIIRPAAIAERIDRLATEAADACQDE